MRGLAICWPARSSRIAAIAARGRVPIYGRPLQASIPGSQLALVAPDGTTQLTCVIKDIDGPMRVRDASGTVTARGYELVAKPGTVRISRFGRISHLNFRWRAEGQIRYFDARTLRPIIIGEPELGGEFLTGTPRETAGERVKFKEFSGHVPGLDPDHPESRLVQRYVAWIGGDKYFVHAQALPDGGYTDLFNKTRWTLFEAKATSDDRRVREAFGQLYDYKRSFPRSPSLALLLPSRPRQRMRAFLQHFGVAAVWQSITGNFLDSVGGNLTSRLRREYRERAA